MFESDDSWFEAEDKQEMETERPLFVDPVDPFFNEVESQIDENKA